jgi:RHH-type transcriptional regulator, rel operon repressor / antitoxin RelB
MSVVFSIRVPEELAQELEQIAAQTERPRSFHVHKALETYVREFADLQIALDRLHDQSDPVVSPRDLRDSLGL